MYGHTETTMNAYPETTVMDDYEMGVYLSEREMYEEIMRDTEEYYGPEDTDDEEEVSVITEEERKRLMEKAKDCEVVYVKVPKVPIHAGNVNDPEVYKYIRPSYD